jgi:tetratricopeptide (TPR) repeat protein
MRTRWRRISVLLVALALSGCSSRTGLVGGVALPPPLQQAQQHLQRGDTATAKQAIDSFLQQSPSMRSYQQVLVLLNENRQYALVIEYAQRALKDSRLKLSSLEEARLWQIQGDSHAYLKRYDEAAACYEEALQRVPNDPVVLNNYAYTLAQANTRLDEAEAMANRALAQDANNPIYLDTLGWIYYRQGRYAQAVQVLEQAVQDAPQEPEIRYHLGMAYWRRGRLPEARVELRKAANLWRIRYGEPYQEALDALKQVEKGIAPSPSQGQRQRVDL